MMNTRIHVRMSRYVLVEVKEQLIQLPLILVFVVVVVFKKVPNCLRSCQVRLNRFANRTRDLPLPDIATVQY